MISTLSLQSVQAQLAKFAAQGNFEQVMSTAFGSRLNQSKLQGLRQQWLSGNFSVIPDIQVLSQGELGSANGAYAAGFDKIFVSADFLARATESQVTALILEEVGHRIDQLLNGGVDSTGDEGEIFGRLVSGETLSAERLAALKTENDHGVINVGGVAVAMAIEQQNYYYNIQGDIINGTDENDYITGDIFSSGVRGSVYVYGNGGNDEILGYVGNGHFYGGDGNDTIKSVNDTVYGDGGDDSIYGNGYLDGGDGDDYISGHLPRNFFDDRNTLSGGAGRDYILGGNGYDLIYGDGNNDYIFGDSGVDEIYGGSGNDVLLGDIGNDFLYGGSEDDILYGGDNNDYLHGDSGDDTLSGGDGSNNLDGGADNDRLFGGAEYDYLNGGDGNDTLEGNTGSDNLYGGDGQDILIGGEGDDQMSGGNGNDTISGGIGNDNIAAGYGAYDTNESLSGGEGDDTITGGYGKDIITGGIGNDSVDGGSGDDYIVGESGNDTLRGGSGNDTYAIDADVNTGLDGIIEVGTGGIDAIAFTYTTKSVAVNLSSVAAQTVATGVQLTAGSLIYLENAFGGAGSDTLTGNDLDNSLYGGEGNDVLYGKGGSDRIDGGFGNDIITGGAGNDTYVIDADVDTGLDRIIEVATGGVDTIDLTATTKSVAVNLSSAVAQTIAAGVQLTAGSLIYLENAFGGAGNDTLTGNDLGNSLYGGLGNDVLYGKGGSDSIDGGNGDDIIIGGAGAVQYLYGRAGRNIYVIDADTDFGYNYIGDFAGYHTLDFRSTSKAIHVSLESSFTQTVAAGVDIYLNNVSSVYGGAGNDTLGGTSSSNYLLGGAGNDILTGYQGNDVLGGGAGVDRFVYSGYDGFGLSTIPYQFGRDTITDFTVGVDKIVLSKGNFKAISGVNMALATNFARVANDGAVATSAAAIVYSQGSGNLYYNENRAAAGFGAKGGNFAVLNIPGLATHPTLTAGDFVLIA